MSPTMPTVTPEAQEVLRYLEKVKVVRGEELLRQLRGMDTSTLIAAVKQLRAASLVDVSGNLANDDDLLFAVVNVVPSAVPMIKFLIG
jgi:hypothetical protein